MDKNELAEQIENGAFLCRIIVEILGAPVEHVTKTMEKVISQIKERDNLTVLQAKVFEPKLEEKEQLYSTFTEMEIQFKNMAELIGFCFDYMPSSVEIMEPQTLELGAPELSSWINEVQSVIHDVDRKLREAESAFKITERNMHHVIRYSILHACKSGATASDLLNAIGIDSRSLEAYLHKLTERKELTKNGEVYTTGKHITFKPQSQGSGNQNGAATNESNQKKN